MDKFYNLCNVFASHPDAVALLKGSDNYPDIYGRVCFYGLPDAVVVRAELMGLPPKNEACGKAIFGFHIHKGTECSGNNTDAFSKAEGHYNPENCMHPYHAGDMPPLFAVGGRAISTFLTDRFTVAEVLGRTVIVHGSPDDFTTQPSGNAGEKIACGIIVKRK